MSNPLRLTFWIAPLLGAALALAPVTAMAGEPAHGAEGGHSGGGHGWHGGGAWRAERVRQRADSAARADLRQEGAFDWRLPQAPETGDYTLQIEALGRALALEDAERCARLRAAARTALDAEGRLRSLGCEGAD